MDLACKQEKIDAPRNRPALFFCAARPKFLVASAAPIFVGFALGFAVAGSFDFVYFGLALLSIMFLHSGANIANDYFDHISGNDWLNQNPTPFSGGRRYIQEGILSPRATIIASIVSLAIGSVLGLIIFLLTGSLFILFLGLAGALGGFFYTAPPFRLGYRCMGELAIAILFGLLPVYGAYFLQTQTIDATAILPAAIVSILIFLVILINEFPDAEADAGANKNTLVVRFGAKKAMWIYRIAILITYPPAIVMMLSFKCTFLAGALYLLTLPLAVIAIRSANLANLTKPGQFQTSQITVLLHTLGCLALTAGFVLDGVF